MIRIWYKEENITKADIKNVVLNHIHKHFINPESAIEDYVDPYIDTVFEILTDNTVRSTTCRCCCIEDDPIGYIVNLVVTNLYKSEPQDSDTRFCDGVIYNILVPKGVSIKNSYE